jgi:hypothetical protein
VTEDERQLNREIAEEMWQLKVYLDPKDRLWWIEAPYTPFGRRALPEYHSDMNLAHIVEERIAELGLEAEYVDALTELLDGDVQLAEEWGVTNATAWKLLHASAADRCRAALTVVRGQT